MPTPCSAPDVARDVLRRLPGVAARHARRRISPRRCSRDVPALLLSGELDPVTPPRYGEQVLKGLPNGRHLVLRGQGHSVIGVGCMPKLLGQFIETRRRQGARRQVPGHASATCRRSPVQRLGAVMPSRLPHAATARGRCAHDHRQRPAQGVQDQDRRGQGRRRRRLRGARRPDHRPARPQRRRQDHHPAHALHADEARRGPACWSTASTRRATRPRCAARSACCPTRAASTSA